MVFDRSHSLCYLYRMMQRSKDILPPVIPWIDGAIRFNGKKWERMDPTFASTANSSKKIMQYIGDGSNYDPKLIY